MKSSQVVAASNRMCGWRRSTEGWGCDVILFFFFLLLTPHGDPSGHLWVRVDDSTEEGARLKAEAE